MSDSTSEHSYGDLTDAEYGKFLHVIESDDDDMECAEDRAGKGIEAEEDLLPDEMLTDNAWIKTRQWEKTEDGRYVFAGIGYHLRSDHEAYKEESLRRQRAKGTEVSVMRAKERKQKRIVIARAACNQTDIHISDKVTQDQLRLLIADLTKEHTEMVDKLFAYINRRFETLLRPLIPRSLKLCAEQYPQSVVKCKGFMYRASDEYGKGLYFWVTPDIPYYFTQGTEQGLLEKLKPTFLYKVDKAIAQYDYHKNARAEKEVKYATVLVDKGVNTYYDLLKHNPFWFERLYRIVTGKDLEL